MMHEPWKTIALDQTGATDVARGEAIQSLWSGYGEIFRAHFAPADFGSVVVKHIAPGSSQTHPRGWDTDLSTQRKLRSYEIEAHWYADWSSRVIGGGGCRIPKWLGATSSENERWIVLEDLDAAGFDQRRGRLDVDTARVCLKWLARFHGKFLGQPPSGLWPVGTYWHLETRPDEWKAMSAGPLKDCASQLDRMLNECEFQTIVHGDAKVANFCFTKTGEEVAAVDFQYVGGGCGMKDVAYFFGSCFDESECERFVPALLDDYFAELRDSISEKPVDFGMLEAEWRDLFAPAWTDFYRFLSGWVPGHAKIHRYTKKLAEETLRRF